MKIMMMRKSGGRKKSITLDSRAVLYYLMSSANVLERMIIIIMITMFVLKSEKETFFSLYFLTKMLNYITKSTAHTNFSLLSMYKKMTTGRVNLSKKRNKIVKLFIMMMKMIIFKCMCSFHSPCFHGSPCMRYGGMIFIWTIQFHNFCYAYYWTLSMVKSCKYDDHDNDDFQMQHNNKLKGRNWIIIITNGHLLLSSVSRLQQLVTLLVIVIISIQWFI